MPGGYSLLSNFIFYHIRASLSTDVTAFQNRVALLLQRLCAARTEKTRAEALRSRPKTGGDGEISRIARDSHFFAALVCECEPMPLGCFKDLIQRYYSSGMGSFCRSSRGAFRQLWLPTPPSRSLRCLSGCFCCIRKALPPSGSFCRRQRPRPRTD